MIGAEAHKGLQRTKGRRSGAIYKSPATEQQQQAQPPQELWIALLTDAHIDHAPMRFCFRFASIAFLSNSPPKPAAYFAP
jgi:hypothetical protein